LDVRNATVTATLFFDHGVGSWRSASIIPFDSMAPITDQLLAIDVPLLLEIGPDGKFFASRLT